VVTQFDHHTKIRMPRIVGRYHQDSLRTRKLLQNVKTVDYALATDIHESISDKEKTLHATNIQQAQELDEFYKNKFIKLGLYDYLSTSLNRLYREAYNLAYNMAKMAERTYKFETYDDTIFIANDNWQLDNAGCLQANVYYYSFNDQRTL
jgi:hypothetical protein